MVLSMGCSHSPESMLSESSQSSSEPSSTSSSSTQETSSSQSSSAEVTDDFNPKKKKIGYELFLNRPEELLYLEDINRIYGQALGKVDIRNFWLDYDQEKDLFRLYAQSIDPSRWWDFLFQPDGTVMQADAYPSGSCPNPIPSGERTIQWDYELEKVVQFKDGNVVPLDLPELESINPAFKLAISSDEKWISYIIYGFLIEPATKEPENPYGW